MRIVPGIGFEVPGEVARNLRYPFELQFYLLPSD
jgi:hypothetical protein